MSEDGPHHKIIDSAFKMTEQLLGASNQLARRVVSVTEDTLGDRIEEVFFLEIGQAEVEVGLIESAIDLQHLAGHVGRCR